MQYFNDMKTEIATEDQRNNQHVKGLEVKLELPVFKHASEKNTEFVIAYETH